MTEAEKFDQRESQHIGRLKSHLIDSQEQLRLVAYKMSNPRMKNSTRAELLEQVKKLKADIKQYKLQIEQEREEHP